MLHQSKQAISGWMGCGAHKGARNQGQNVIQLYDCNFVMERKLGHPELIFEKLADIPEGLTLEEMNDFIGEERWTLRDDELQEECYFCQN